MAVTNPQVSFGPRFHPRSAPVTFWLLVVCGVLWLLLELLPGRDSAAAALQFQADGLAQQPWSVLTYALVHSGWSPFSLFFLGYVMWWAGAEVEGWWGSRIHAAFLVVVTVATALLLALGAALLGQPAADQGLITPLCAVLTIWALRDLRRPLILLVVPATGAILLVLEALTQWLRFDPALGLFALAGGVGLPALYFYYGHHLHRLFRRRPRRRTLGPHLRDVDHEG